MVGVAVVSDLLIMLLKSDFTKRDEKFTWGGPTEAKNPKNKKKYEKNFFSKGPLGQNGKRGVISKSDKLANRTQHCEKSS